MTAGLLKEIDQAETAVRMATSRLMLWATQMEDVAIAQRTPEKALAMVDEFSARRYELLAAHARLRDKRAVEAVMRKQAHQGSAVKAANDEEGRDDG